MISQRGYTCDLAAGQRTSSIKSVRILAGSVEPWNTNGGKDCSRGGGGGKKEKRKERRREILKLTDPFLSFRHFGPKETPIPANVTERTLFCHISRVLIFWTTIRARNE